MIYTLIGFFAGIIGGMGMGGGTILIPALIMFVNIDPKIAQSINLLSSIPMAIFALIIHIKNKNVVLKLVIPIALFGVLSKLTTLVDITSRFASPSFTTDKSPECPLNALKPATSPSFIFEISSETVALHFGPSIRCVIVFGARYRLSTTRLVSKRKYPGRSVSDHLSSTGL